MQRINPIGDFNVQLSISADALTVIFIEGVSGKIAPVSYAIREHGTVATLEPLKRQLSFLGLSHNCTVLWRKRHKTIEIGGAIFSRCPEPKQHPNKLSTPWGFYTMIWRGELLANKREASGYGQP